MLRPFIAAAFAAACLLCSCGNNMRSQEKVEAAIKNRLQSKAGLNLSELEVSTTSVRFDKNLAFATVAIHPKADTDVSKGMSMKYTLEDRNGQWVVMDPLQPHGGVPAARPDAQGLPSGHPAIDPNSLPPGHAPAGHLPADHRPANHPPADLPGGASGRP